jgi:hypothetical protein
MIAYAGVLLGEDALNGFGVKIATLAELFERPNFRPKF